MEKRRYILFGYYGYYPSGGMKDALFSFNTESELIEEASHYEYDYYNIFDTETFNIMSGQKPILIFRDLNS